MKTIEKIDLIKKLKIYEQKNGFDNKLKDAQKNIAEGDDEELKKLFAEYIEGSDKELLLGEDKTASEIAKQLLEEDSASGKTKSAEEEVIENFLGPIALGMENDDVEDSPVFVGNIEKEDEHKWPEPTEKVATFEYQDDEFDSGSFNIERALKEEEESGFRREREEAQASSKAKLEAIEREQFTGREVAEEDKTLEKDNAQKASDIVAVLSGDDKKKPVKPATNANDFQPVYKIKETKPKNESAPSGSVGKATVIAILMGLIGVALFCGVFFLGYISGWVALITVFLAAFGYKKVCGGMDNKGYVIVSLITVFEMLLSLVLCYGFFFNELLELGSIISGINAIIPSMGEYPEIKVEVLTNLAITLGFSLVGIVSYIIYDKKRK